MANLTIPLEFYESFKTLISIPFSKFSELIESAEEIGEDFTSDEVVSEISKKSEISEDEINEIFRLLVNLIAIKEIRNFEAPVLIDELRTSLKEKDIEPSEEFGEKLNKIIGNKKSLFYIKAKSFLISSENSKAFVDSRIFSDIRPIFSDEVQEEFLGSIILHQLKIEYRERDEVKETYITLDSNDLTVVKEQISRAEKKEEAIRKKMSSNSFKIFNLNS